MKHGTSHITTRRRLVNSRPLLNSRRPLAPLGMVTDVRVLPLVSLMLLLISTVLLPWHGSAQSTPVRQLVDSKTCRGCRLELDTIARISDSDFEFKDLAPPVAQTAHSLILIGQYSSIGVFDAKGKYLRTLGRAGSGPSEFRRIATMKTAHGDSILVNDGELGRTSVLNPEATTIVRSFNSPFFTDVVPLSNHRFLSSGVLATRESKGFTLHVLSASGTAQHSFNADSNAHGITAGREMRRIMGLTHSGVVTSPQTAYTIQQWSDELRLVATYNRIVPWFPRLVNTATIDIPNRKPIPTLLNALIGSSATNRVLSVILTAASDFKPDPKVVGLTGETPRSLVASGADINRYVDTIFELLDLSSSTVLATKRVKGAYRAVATGRADNAAPLCWTMREAADGSYVLEIVRIRFVQK